MNLHPLPAHLGVEILRTEVGSTLHGTGLAGGEDHDEMGIYVELPNSVIGLDKQDQYIWRTAVERQRALIAEGGLVPERGKKSPRSQPGDTDLTVYTLRKWCSLALKGNPSVLLPQFAPQDKVFICEPIGAHLRIYTQWFWSKDAIKAFLGYMQAQRARMQGDRGTAGRVRKQEDGSPDWKYAMHMLRLGYQGIEYATTARITLPFEEPLRSQLIEVRKGEVPLREVLADAARLEMTLETLLHEGSAPDHAAYDEVNKFLVRAHRMVWRDRGLLL